jgi:CRISPR system Cascade subunit CasE
MFLSQFMLDLKNRQVQNELQNRYELHRTLTAQFPDFQREEIGLLYRIEIPEGYLYSAIKLLVQTQVEPCWDGLWQRGMLLERPLVKTFIIRANPGSTYYFRILANPTVRKTQPGEENGKRVGLYDRSAQEEWFRRKAESGGFGVAALQMKDLGMMESLKRSSGITHIIRHLAVQFEGSLEVKDPDRLHTTLRKGIGSAKAFGFGLLSLAKG